MLKKDFKFKIIKNFLSQEEILLLKDYCRIKHRLNDDHFDFGVNNNMDTSYYADPLTESLMLNKLKILEKETKLELLPTYSYWRMYTKFAHLQNHLDREACEISVTVSIASDNTSWPIFIDGNKIELEHGSAAIYLGCELEHWRETFTGDWYAQAFLHYVDKNGPYREFAKDNRILYGQKNRNISIREI